MYTYYDSSCKAGWAPVLAFAGILTTSVMVFEWIAVHHPHFVRLTIAGAVCAFMVFLFILGRRIPAASKQLSIRVDDDGIYSLSWSDKLIPWSNIAHAEIGVEDPQSAMRRCWLTLKDRSLDPPRQANGWFSFIRNRRNRVCLTVPNSNEVGRLVSAIGQWLPEGVKQPSALAGTVIFLARIIQLISLRG